MSLLHFATGTQIFTARVAKRAKVMSSQSCVTSTSGGGATPKVYYLPPPRARSQHLPPDNTSLPPGQYFPPPWTMPPSPMDNTSLPHQTMRRRAVRILLECILVDIASMSSDMGCFCYQCSHVTTEKKRNRCRQVWMDPTLYPLMSSNEFPVITQS